MSGLVTTILVLFIVIVIQLKHATAFQAEPLVKNYDLNTSYPTYTTSIERTATFSNGCYKQRITEPDLWNSNRFFETEQLMCPPAVNASTFIALTQQLQLNSSRTNHTTHFLRTNNTSNVILPPSGFFPANNFINGPQNITYIPHVAPAQSNPTVPALSHPINPSFNHQQPFIPAMNATNATSHAAILSKKTGFYGNEKNKSSAQTIKNVNCVFMFMVVTIIFNRTK